MLGGAVRAALGVGGPASLAAGAVLWCVLISVLLWRLRPQPAEWGRCAAVAFAALLTLSLAAWALGAPAFGGLVSGGGGDGGNHAMVLRRFTTEDPRPYHAFVAFHEMAYAGEVLFGLDPFHAIRLAFFAVPATVILAGAVAVALPHSQASASRRGPLAIVAAGFLFSLVLWGALLPMLHYLQADGFYPQLCAFVTLVLVWLTWGLLDDVLLRVGALLLGVTLYRYSYGLNLGDAALCVAALCLVEARRSHWSRTGRALFVAIAVAMVAGAAVILRALYPLRSLTGGLVAPETGFLLGGLYLGSILLLACSHAPRLSRRSDAPSRRLFEFAGLFGLISALIETAYFAAGHPHLYFILKHGFHPAMLVTLAVFVLAARMLGAMLGAAGPGDETDPLAIRLVRVTFALSLGAVALFWASANPYRHSFVDRARRTPPFKWIDPLYDLDAAANIQRVLEDGKSSFGGYLAPFWAEANFTNAVFDHPRSRGPEIARAASPPAFWMFHAEAMVRQPGYCVFWQDSTENIRYLEHVAADPEMREFNLWEAVGPLKSMLQQLDASDQTRCVEYPMRWEPSNRRRLCHRCF